jgi:hypothetical protein
MSLSAIFAFILRKLVTPWLSEWFFKFVHRYWFMLVYALVCAVNYYVVQEDLDPATCGEAEVSWVCRVYLL